MSHGDFMRMTENDAWRFFEEMAEKGMQWEGFSKKLLTTTSSTTSKSGMHLIENSIAAEAKMVALMRRIKALEIKGTSPQLDHII